jgi:two-component system cell cycle response regulator
MGVECILVSTRLGSHDPLRLCAHLRALESTRSIPIVLLADGEEEDTVVRGLELGINDYLVKPIEKQELVARLRTQIRRKRYNDGLRSSFARTVEMAVTDPLTGLHNRRYLDSHLQTLFDRARARNKPLSIMFADIDRFKTINDSWGHDGGDAVLREFAARLRKTLRAIDLVCRYGGEEFVVVMPETDLAVAERVAERVRGEIAGEGFRPAEGKPAISVTASLGVAASRGTDDDSLEQLVKRADEALYEAKRSGRNRVVAPAA